MKNRKIYLKMIAVVGISTLAVLFLFRLLRGRAANWIVGFLQKHTALSYDDARHIYSAVIRQNLDILVLAAIAVCVAVLSAILIFSSRKQRAKDVKLAEQRKNELIAYLAHDIKTPLTSVIGYLSLLNESPDMPDEQKAKHIGIALDKAYRLEGLVNQFFEITQYHLQAIALSKKDIDLYYMLMQLGDEVYPQLDARRKAIAIHAAEDLTVYGDPDKLARAFHNILRNAIVYGEDDSVIDLTAKKKNDLIMLEFRNAGSIPKEKLQAIFEKFQRLDEARSSDTGGAGLGLAIAKEIVLAHGGKIYADSGGEHTTFTVELPLKKF